LGKFIVKPLCLDIEGHGMTNTRHKKTQDQRYCYLFPPEKGSAITVSPEYKAIVVPNLFTMHPAKTTI
jgi:hypothetical protein